VELAALYDAEGADELVFLDITASSDERRTMIEVVERTAEQVFIPFTVGGGIRATEDMRLILSGGADKIAINTAAVANPFLITEGAAMFGSQCIVVAIDAKRVGGEARWEVFTHGGRKGTGRDAVQWAKEAERLGAGEILLTSMDADGTQDGYDLELTRTISRSVSIPVIASGGAGTLEHLAQALTQGEADAALAASIFHYGKYKIQEAKEYLAKKGIAVRLA